MIVYCMRAVVWDHPKPGPCLRASWVVLVTLTPHMAGAAAVAHAVPSWQELKWQARPGSEPQLLHRAGHTATAYGKYIYVFGGRKG